MPDFTMENRQKKSATLVHKRKRAVAQKSEILIACHSLFIVSCIYRVLSEWHSEAL